MHIDNVCAQRFYAWGHFTRILFTVIRLRHSANVNGIIASIINQLIALDTRTLYRTEKFFPSHKLVEINPSVVFRIRIYRPSVGKIVHVYVLYSLCREK